MKACIKCKRRLDLDLFPRDRQMKDGRKSTCHDCHRREVSAYTAAHLAEKRARDKARRISKREMLSAQRRAHHLAHPEMTRASRAAYEARHPERVAARKALRDAVAAGRVEKLPCEVCGATKRIHGHHAFGYEPANWLTVMWLCEPHHKLAHSSAALSGGGKEGA